MKNISLTYIENESRAARVDDLGRIVIPTEMRKKLNLKTGEPLSLVVATDEDNQPVLLGTQFSSMHPFERRCNKLLHNLVVLAKQNGFGPSMVRIYDDTERLVASDGTNAVRSNSIAKAIGEAVHALLSDHALDNIHSVVDPDEGSAQEMAVFATALRDQFTGNTLGVLALADSTEVVEVLQIAARYAAISFDGRED